jgi:ABC-type multidrug transport system ATPase subunit/ABC-type multidrug transport system permease subunit
MDRPNTPKEVDTSDSEICQLARRISAAESDHLDHGSPFDALECTALDPNSEKFDAKLWSKRFYDTLYASDPARVMGVAYENLHVFGYGSDTDYQNTVANWPLKLPKLFHRLINSRRQKVDILDQFEGLIRPSEMVCVLGPPGSGCSTLLKTIAGETHGLNIGEQSKLNYNGILPETLRSMFRGEAIYTAEVDVHYPMLSVGTTLYFAALARAPYSLPAGISREQYAAHMRDVVMSQLGISHIKSTRVGNDFVRGVSGGERKRVTIAEATLSGAPLQCWDNSTRGLDSANAIEFCRTLRTQANVFGVASMVAIYQAPQQAYDTFDKVCVLYEGRQIYFGPARQAQGYFERLGFVCPEGQSTPDFLTSMSSPSQRTALPGFADRVPRTPADFVKAWMDSTERKEFLSQIADYNVKHPLMAESYQRFAEQRRLEKSRKQRVRSPYNMSLWRQIQLCLWRDWQRLKADPSVPIVMLAMNLTEVLLVSSIFFGLDNTTSSFYARGASIFILILLNAFGSLLEIMGLYAKRDIVEKHKRYALYHPSAEAIASMIMDMPYKLTNCLCTVILFYFMVNLRQDAGRFFFFLLNSFFVGLSMSMFFRLFASATKTLAQALAPASVMLIAMTLYEGFAIPNEYVLGWASWIRWVNPAAYGFESAMLNEFVDRQFSCDQLVPVGSNYTDVPENATTCAVKGARPGENFVDGAEYLRVAFGFENSHKWRNFGILVAITIGLCAAHLVVSEIVAAARSKGEVLVFKRGALKQRQNRKPGTDEEDQAGGQRKVVDKDDAAVEANVAKQTSILHWQNVSYTVKSGGEERTILDNVDGWVKPGTLTALMGVSGVSSHFTVHARRIPFANVLSGRQNHATGCTCKPRHYGCGDGRHAS